MRPEQPSKLKKKKLEFSTLWGEGVNFFDFPHFLFLILFLIHRPSVENSTLFFSSILTASLIHLFLGHTLCMYGMFIHLNITWNILIVIRISVPRVTMIEEKVVFSKTLHSITLTVGVESKVLHLLWGRKSWLEFYLVVRNPVIVFVYLRTKQDMVSQF